jgi:hypothetical protein
MPEEGEGRKPPKMVSFTDIARLVVELGYVDNMTRAGVRRISLTHPKWPIPEGDLVQIGNAKVMPWEPVEKFFREDYSTRGRGPDRQPRQRKEDGSGQ